MFGARREAHRSYRVLTDSNTDQRDERTISSIHSQEHSMKTFTTLVLVASLCTGVQAARAATPDIGCALGNERTVTFSGDDANARQYDFLDKFNP
jgi:hypothetical protein